MTNLSRNWRGLVYFVDRMPLFLSISHGIQAPFLPWRNPHDQLASVVLSGMTKQILAEKLVAPRQPRSNYYDFWKGQSQPNP